MPTGSEGALEGETPQATCETHSCKFDPCDKFANSFLSLVMDRLQVALPPSRFSRRWSLEWLPGVSRLSVKITDHEGNDFPYLAPIRNLPSRNFEQRGRRIPLSSAYL